MTQRIGLGLLVSFVFIVSIAASGCQFGRFSMHMNRNHVIPLPEVDVLPDQWEPEPVEN